MSHELTVNPNEQTNFSDDIMKRASRGSLTRNSESPNMYSANSHDVAALTQAASMRLASEAMRASAESLAESSKRMQSQESVASAGAGKQAPNEKKIEEELDEVLSPAADETKLTLNRNMSTKPATPSELTHHEDFDDDDDDSDESKTHSSSPAPPTA